MTSHVEGHTTTDVKPDMLSGVQTGNGIPHDRYYIRGITHGCTNSGGKGLVKNQDRTRPELTQP